MKTFESFILQKMTTLLEATSTAPTSTNTTSTSAAPTKATSPTEIIKSYLPYIDLNKQISVESKKGVIIDLIKKEIKDENDERSQSREKKLEISPDEVYIKLKKKIIDSLKATRGDYYRDINSKLMWMYILADPNQTINLQS